MKKFAAAFSVLALVAAFRVIGFDHDNEQEEEAEQTAAREAFRIVQLQDENHQILPGSWGNAWAQKQAMPFLAEAWSEFPNVPGPGPLPWVSIGPGRVGGRVRGILIDPNNPNRIWVSGVSGGVWASENGGLTWTTNTDFVGNINVAHMVLDPSNSKTIYVATGGETLTGNGIFRSDDAGKRWVALGSTQNNPNFAAVNRLAMSPNGVILAGTTSGLFRSTDRGASWTEVIVSADIYDVHFHPSEPAIALCSGRVGNIYHSENGGLTWSKSTFPIRPPGTGTIKVEYSKSNPSIVYANTLTESQAGQLYRSADGGLSFIPRGPCCTGVLWWANCLWIDPTNPNTVIFGGGTIYRSFDGGLTRVFANALHEDHQLIVADPRYDGVTNKTVYCGTDGGLSKTTNVLRVPVPEPPFGQSHIQWENLNNGLEITQFLGAAGNEQSGVIVGGTQDNGNLIYNGSAWGGLTWNDGGYVAADQNDSRYFYLETMWLTLYRSSNSGKSAEYIGYNMPHNCNGVPCANFTAPFVLDPNDSNVLLGGGYPLWKSSNVRADDPHAITWKEIKPAIPAGSFISAVAVKKGNSNVIWVGHLNGEIYMTQNGTGQGKLSPVWTKMSAGLPGRYCSHITISGDVVYATFGGFSQGNIWRYADGQWADISQGLPHMPIYTVVVSPFNPQCVYIGTELGVFASSNYGNSWSPGGPADVAVFTLFWMGDRLYAATFGRGMFKRGPAIH